MNKEELFKKYSINESHSEWNNRIDNWMSVEVFRIMHEGRLPTENDISVKYVTDFLDKTKDMKFMCELMKRQDWGSLYLTAKRMVYQFSEQLLNKNYTT